MASGTSLSSRERALAATVVVLVGMLAVLIFTQIANDSSPGATPPNIDVIETTPGTSNPSDEETFPITTDPESTTTVVASPVVTEPNNSLPEKSTTTLPATTTTSTQPPTRKVNLSISVKIVGATPAPGELSIVPLVECFRQDHFELRGDQVVRVGRKVHYSTEGDTVDGVQLIAGSFESFSFSLSSREQSNCVLRFNVIGDASWYSSNIRDARTRINGAIGFPGTGIECLVPMIGRDYYLDQGDGPEYLPFASEKGCSLEVELLA